jgi:sulfur-carrier protein adenylyltransferase/sulfurtransferase
MTDPLDVPELTPTDLKERLDRGDVPLLVDVREHFERRIADLPEHGQLRIPTGELYHRMGELDRRCTIVLYCRSGSRSAWAARLLLERGYTDVFNLRGGVLGWRQEVDPTLQAY